GKVIDGGGGFSATYYSSSYFVTLVLAHEGHVSPKKANQVFDQRLRQAVQVFELGPKTNREGKVVGQRAFALFFSPVCSCYYGETLWTDGRVLDYIYSTSGLHVREFEKQQR